MGHAGEVNHQVALAQQEQNGTITDMQTEGNYGKHGSVTIPVTKIYVENRGM